MKKCYKCKEEKSLNLFSKDRTTKDSLCTKCKLCSKQYRRKYDIENASIIAEKKKEYYRINKIAINEKNKAYNRKNKDILNAYSNKRRKEDLNFKLTLILRQRVSKIIRKNYKNGSALKDLGCTLEELRLHLESKFKIDMNWNNYGKGHSKWSIDHIVPLSKFNLSNREDFLKACNYKNLQPLWFYENSKKGNSYNE